MDDYNWDLEELAQCVERWGLSQRKGNFLRPHNRIWPQDLSIEQCCSNICAVLSAQDKVSFLTACAASALLSNDLEKERMFHWFVSNNIKPADLELPFECWNDLLRWKWIKVAIPLVSPHTGKGVMVDSLFGAGPEPERILLPADFPENAGQETLKAINTAKKLLPPHDNTGLFFWPIIEHGKRAGILGDSLALPVCLGWRTLLEGASPPEISATGALSDTGSIVRVGYLDEKIAAAESHGLKGLLIPSECALSPAKTHAIELIAVSNLAEAWISWTCFSPGKGTGISSTLRNLDSTLARALMFIDMPARFLSFVGHSSSTVSKTIKQVLADKRNGKLFLNHLEEIAAAENVPPEGLGFVLSFFSPELIGEEVGSPDLVFRLSRIMLWQLNRAGKIAEEEKWAKLASDMIPISSHWEEADSRILNFYNLQIVSLHNRFCFEPDLMERMDPDLKHLLDQFENNLAIRRQRDPLAVSFELGAFYGTLAQHYAFCGPAHLERFEKELNKALDAFGHGQVRGEPYDQWLRDISYRVYAYLDAGRFSEAEHALMVYLMVNDIQQLKPFKNAYKAAALFRFAADTGLAGIVTLAKSSLEGLPKTHPYQLCLYNAGRLKGVKADQRASWWKESVGSCFSQGGATIKAMALLPLSQLYIWGLEGEDYLAKHTDEVLEVISQEPLDNKHFKILLDANGWKNVLEQVEISSKSLFPFTHR